MLRTESAHIYKHGDITYWNTNADKLQNIGVICK